MSLHLGGCGADTHATDAAFPRVTPRYGNNGHGGTVTLEENGLLLNGASCMGDNALASGLINGMKDATDLNCTSPDIALTEFIALHYSYDGETLIPIAATEPISCNLGETIYLDMVGKLVQHANSPRPDVGVWVSFDNTTALTGSCQQYTLSPGALGSFNVDGDACGDLLPGSITDIPFGLVAVQCRDNGSGLLEVGTCIAWKQPGSDNVCPIAGNELGYRYGSLPGGRSKCNCQSVTVPVQVIATPLGES